MNKLFFLLAFSVFAFQHQAYAQGCSDAGVCTMESFKPSLKFDNELHNKNQIKIGVSTGKADHEISVLAGYLSYVRNINDSWTIDAKLTGISQKGNGFSNSGLSDVFLNANYALTENSGISFGVKLPLSQADGKQNGLDLPMDYQSSLGTVDILLGYAQKISNWQFVLGFQQPIIQNKNAFVNDLDFPDFSQAFHTTNQFKRAGDVLLRVSYPFALSNKLSFTPSLLPIYHLANDKYTYIDTEYEIKGSSGLTLNANAYFDYNINASNALQLSVGAPLVVRDLRPDGLTRSFVATLEYSFKF